MWYRENFKLSCSVRACREKRYHERRNKSDGCFEAEQAVGVFMKLRRTRRNESES